MTPATSIAKKWLYHVDLLEYYVLCSDCFFQAGDQFTGFSGSSLTTQEKRAVEKQAAEYFHAAQQCDRCKSQLTQNYPGLQTSCPMQDNCHAIPNNPHYYPGECKRWEECQSVYSDLRGGAGDEDTDECDW